MQPVMQAERYGQAPGPQRRDATTWGRPQPAPWHGGNETRPGAQGTWVGVCVAHGDDVDGFVLVFC
jgi:hypothetical protein